MYKPTIDTLDASLTEDILASLGGSPAENSETPDSLTKGLSKAIADPSSHYSPGASTSVEERALHLLGSGVPAESAASALGVTPSRISQLLAEESFSKKVAALRYESLQKHNRRDDKYNSLEDTLLEKLTKSLPLMVRPESILKAISIVNGAKRRGQSSPEQVTNQQNIVNIILPTIIADKFTVNADNQVISAGDHPLITMQSGNLLKQVEAATTKRESNLIEQKKKEE